MIKVIRRGQVPEHYVLRYICPICGTWFYCHLEDCILTQKHADNEGVYFNAEIDCPECGNTLKREVGFRMLSGTEGITLPRMFDMPEG